jgi:hypothetical protein
MSRQPTDFGPFRGRFNIQPSGEFQPYGFIANRLAGICPAKDQFSEK